MVAVILAAGDGTRMAALTQRYPKPLIPLEGRPLITYVLTALSPAGIERGVIVTGHRGEVIERTLGDGRAYGLRLRYVRSPHSGSGSALSLYAARQAVGNRPFLLLMADHLVSPELVQRMVQPPPLRYTLCVDQNARWVDHAEATRVWVEADGRIRRIGKGLFPYNGVDTGLFWLGPGVFPAVRMVQAISGSPPTLTHVMQWLMAHGPGLWVRWVSGAARMDVDTPEDLLRARRWLQEHSLLPGRYPAGQGGRVEAESLLAVIIATEESGGRPLAAARLCGVPVIARTLRALRAAGVWEVMIFAGKHGDVLRRAIRGVADGAFRVAVLDREADGLPDALSGRRLLVLEGHYVWDERILAALSRAEPPCLLVDSDSKEVYAGAVICRAEDLPLRVGEGWSSGWLHRARSGGVSTLDMAQMADYRPDIRRDMKPYWFCIRSEADIHRAKGALMERAQKGTLDWWAWFVNRPMENRLLRYLADWPVTPHQMSLLTNLLAYGVALLWASGYLWPWALGAVLVSVLDGLDGKIARVKGMSTRLGSLEHSFDTLWEQVWYVALAWAAFAPHRYLPALALGMALLLLDTFNRHIYMQFRQTAGRSLSEYSPFDRRFRWMDGRRNTYLPYILIGAALGRPLWSLVAMVVHAGLTAVVYTVRASRHLRALDRGG